MLFSLEKRAFLLLLLSLSLSSGQVFAQRYTIRSDTKIPGRRIVSFQPIVERKPLTVSGNLLSANPRQAASRRSPVEFKPFEMVNPRTGKAIAPNARLSLKTSDGRVLRSMEARQFFDELNKLEEELSKNGRSLRQPDAFKDLRMEPVFTVAANQKPVMPSGFETIMLQPLAPSSGRGQSIQPVDPDKIDFNISGKLLRPKVSFISTRLFIAETGTDLGTAEFPVVWVTESLGTPGRKVFPLLIQLNKGLESLVKRIDWQVSEQPFDYTLKASPKLASFGSDNNVSWHENLRGVAGSSTFKDFQKYRFAVVYASMANIPEPVNAVKHYYARALLYNQANELLHITSPVILGYGYKPVRMDIPCTTINTIPNFNYAFPADNKIPFGIFVRGSGVRAASHFINTMNADDPKDNGLKPTGYSVSFNGELGLRYFNFLSIVNPAEPSSNELVLIKSDFSAATGKTTDNEPQGAKIDISFINGLYKESVPLTANSPDGRVNLDYLFSQSLDMEFVNTRFFIGPVPVAIQVGMSGEAGMNLGGEINPTNMRAAGFIRPFLNSRFYVRGGADALIAYATVNTEMNPLMYIEMPIVFDSSGSNPLTFYGETRALYGRIFLRVGFFYPCPDLEKVVGWLTGDEDTPLCECAWEYNIFNFDGINHKWNY